MSYQIEIRHFRYFKALAEDLHFRKASERLFISQPGLSRQIQQLEKELKVKLFKRDNRNVALTQAGEYFKKEVDLLLQNMDNIFLQTQMIHAGLKGQLKFGYIGSAMQNIIPELMVKIRSSFEDLKFDLQEMDNESQIEALLSQKIDVGFVRMDRVPKPIKKKAILNDSFSLVLPKNHRITSRNFKSIKQLEEEPFILFRPSYSQAYFERVMKIFEDAGFNPIVSHNTVHATTIYRLVENNFGVAIVPSSLKLGYNLGVKFIELTKIKQRTTLQAVWNEQNRNPALKMIVKILKEQGELV